MTCAAGHPNWWCYGGAQCDDWDDFFPTLEKRLTLTVSWWRCLAVESGYEYFCDALGTIRDIIEPRSITAIVGHWPTAGYHFEASKGLADDDHFGTADERQSA